MKSKNPASDLHQESPDSNCAEANGSEEDFSYKVFHSQGPDLSKVGK